MRVEAHENHEFHGRGRRGALRRLSLMTLLMPLAACGYDRALVSAQIPDDYRARHSLVMTEAPQTLEIFTTGASLEKSARDRVQELAQHAAHRGRGNIEILFPQGSPHDDRQRAALPAIRKALAAGGARGYVTVGTYPAGDPEIASPVRLSFNALRGRVASTCGQWPVDLASGSSLETWQNRPYWNHGCAYQNMFAVQVADPSDLVEPRATANGDVEMRIRAIGKVRQGSDPGTTWVTKNSSIGSVGSSN